jgi:ribosome-associated toxin RatA of RatAB toxin-antitoxin module
MTDQATQRAIIHAPPERCFAVAIDFARYPEWASDIKQATVLTRDADGRGSEVEYRAAALGRSTTYVLRYNYGSNPLRLSWRLMRGDLMHRLDGEYEFAPVEGDPDSTEVTYYLSVDLAVPLPGFVKRRAEARIMHIALGELKAAAESSFGAR